MSEEGNTTKMSEPFSAVRQKEATILRNGVLLPKIDATNGISLKNGAIHVTKVPRTSIKIMFENENRGKLKTYKGEKTMQILEDNEQRNKGSTVFQNVTIIPQNSRAIFKYLLVSIILLGFFALCCVLLSPRITVIKTHSSTIEAMNHSIQIKGESSNEKNVSVFNDEMFREEEEPISIVLDSITSTLQDTTTAINEPYQFSHNGQDVIEESNDGKDKNYPLDAIDTLTVDEAQIQEKKNIIRDDRKDENNVDDRNPRFAKVLKESNQITDVDTVTIDAGFRQMGNSEVILGLGIISIGAGVAIVVSTFLF